MAAAEHAAAAAARAASEQRREAAAAVRRQREAEGRLLDCMDQVEPMQNVANREIWVWHGATETGP